MAEKKSKVGPREQQLREMRELRASQMMKEQPRVRAKVVGKLASVKAQKGGRGQ